MSTWFIATCFAVVLVTLVLLFATRADDQKILQRILLMYGLAWFSFLVFYAFSCGRLVLVDALLAHETREELAEQYRYQLMSKDHRK